jgi:hypothetical protein
LFKLLTSNFRARQIYLFDKYSEDLSNSFENFTKDLSAALNHIQTSIEREFDQDKKKHLLEQVIHNTYVLF